MDWDDFLRQHRGVLSENHGHERRFVANVLRHVPGPDPAVICPQHGFGRRFAARLTAGDASASG